MKVEDILRLSARLYGQNCRKTALELCQRLKLDTKKPVNQLSLGNRKKSVLSVPSSIMLIYIF